MVFGMCSELTRGITTATQSLYMVRETPELFARSCHGCVIAVDGVVMYVEGGGGGGVEATAARLP